MNYMTWYFNFLKSTFHGLGNAFYLSSSTDEIYTNWKTEVEINEQIFLRQQTQGVVMLIETQDITGSSVKSGHGIIWDILLPQYCSLKCSGTILPGDPALCPTHCSRICSTSLRWGFCFLVLWEFFSLHKSEWIWGQESFVTVYSQYQQTIGWPAMCLQGMKTSFEEIKFLSPKGLSF